MKNPPWTTDELILALDVYFRFPTTDKNHPEILKLSELLNDLPIHKNQNQGETFRNQPGVYMKLMNFRHLDPDHPGDGLKAVSNLDRKVWDEFSQQRTRLHQIAQSIRDNYKSEYTGHGKVDVSISDEDEFQEGKILTRVHKVRERNLSLVRKKKQKILEETGTLDCEVCGFNFEEVYGAIGDGFIECHHTVPISSVRPNQKTKLKDLALVCPNCHRMLHRGKTWISVEELQDKILGQN